MSQYVYFFGGGKADGHKDLKDVLGGKGAGLAEMTNAGLPVPPGFTVSTDVCRIYAQKGELPGEKVGGAPGRWLFEESDVEEFVEKRKEAANAS